MTDPSPEFVAALETTGLLRDEYPEQMAARSCTCTPTAVCGAHRLLTRYKELYARFVAANKQKRAYHSRAMDAEIKLAEAGVPVGGGEPQLTTSTDNGLRRHDPNDDDPVTRAGKAAAALRYAVDLPPDMRDLAYEQVKAGLLSVGGGEPQPTTSTDGDTGGGMDVLCTRCLMPGRGWRWRGVIRCEPCHRLIEGDQATDTLILSDVSAYGEWWTDEFLNRTADLPPVRSAGGGGQPDTSTDNDPEIERQVEQVWALIEGGRSVASAVLEVVGDPPSAGGGDQPDTPCRLCGGSGVKPYEALTDEERAEFIGPPYGHLVPCPACTDKENPHAR